MALDPKGAALALHRFGFGPKAGAIAALASDPLSALLAELEAPKAGQIANADLPTSGAENRTVYEFNAERLAQQKQEQKRKQAAQADMQSADNAMEQNSMEQKPAEQKADATPAAPKPMPPGRQIFLSEARARYNAAINADIGFAERLVWFWSNHFCVNFDSTVMAGAYEREAIRPHVLGRFADMLLAAESHPAMLLYLDNASSIGPNSVAGINRNRGLNENLGARDSRAAYARRPHRLCAGRRHQLRQGDHRLDHPADRGQSGPWRRVRVQPAPARAGAADADRQDLSRTPASSRAAACSPIWRAIRPPPGMSRSSSRAISSPTTRRRRWSSGWRSASSTPTATSRRSPRPWSARPKRGLPSRPRSSARANGSWRSVRATGTQGQIDRMMGAQALLGEPLWRPPAPKGFPDDNATWLDGLALRLASANVFAQRVSPNVDPQAVLETALGPLASEETRLTVARAESKQQALAFVVMAPEFQRR